MKNAIVFGINRQWSFALGTVLLQLQAYYPQTIHDYDIIVFSDSLEMSDKKLLNQLADITFNKFKSGNIHSDKFTRVSKLAFAKYECFSLSAIYNAVLWLDTDIIVKGSLEGLFQKKRPGLYLFKHAGTPARVSFSDSVNGYDLNTDCYNDGIMFIKSPLKNNSQLTSWCYEATNRWADKINSDQAIINLMLQRFNIEINELEEKYNCFPIKEKFDTAIVHSWGELKFWNFYYHPQWTESCRQWQLLGGPTPNSLQISKQNNILKKINYYIKLIKNF